VDAVPPEEANGEDDLMDAQDVAELRDGFPRGARWLDDPIDQRHSDIECRATLAVERALRDVFLMEAPPGSNRGTSIDGYNRRAGAPLGSPYCASAATAWWEDVGLEVPAQSRASCDVLYRWALQTGRFHHSPAIGALILYGTGKKENPADHVGLVIRLTPLVLSVEANTSMDGKFNREGFAFDRKVIDRLSPRILGYVHPSPTRP
jgi:hypothetical protein